MRRILRLKEIMWVLALIEIIFLSACSHSDKSSAKPGKTIILSDDVMANKNTSAAWLAYGLALGAWDINHPNANNTDYFEREVYARTMTAQVWHEFREKGRSPDEALDTLNMVNKARYMREYVWFYLKKPEWTTPGGLRLKEFESWKDKNLVGHVPVIDPGVKAYK